VESIRRGRDYAGKNLLYIAGLNIDISAYRISANSEFPPTTYFVPWAALIQLREPVHPGKAAIADFRYPLEQQDLFELLMQESTRNPDETNLKEEITRMLEAPRFDIRSPK
jgi:hypothetical protein